MADQKGNILVKTIKHQRKYVRECSTCSRALAVVGVLLLLALIIVAVILLISYNETDKTPTVETSVGAIRGRLTASPSGQEVVEYLGIRYAAPPVGNRRFRDPEAPDPTSQPSGPYDAFEYGASCNQLPSELQIPTALSEDCLFLNIWVPRGGDENKAVMVWIHGGGLTTGSAAEEQYDGRSLAVSGDVIVASINYRLISLGFLSTGDDRIKGNFGLKDQALAIKWIHTNIESFGGDPQRITLFGESAGSATVGYHLLTVGPAQTSSHFTRAILQSGTPLSSFGYMAGSSIPDRLTRFLQVTGCENNGDILECLQQVPVETLLNGDGMLGMLGYRWLPTTDNEYIMDNPYRLVKNNSYHHKDILASVVKDEGSLFVGRVLVMVGIDPTQVTYDKASTVVNLLFSDLSQDIRNEIEDTYRPSDTTDPAASREALIQILTDYDFTCPSLMLVDKYSQTDQQVYFGEFSHRASVDVTPGWQGVYHGSDIQWVFGAAMNASSGYTNGEIEHSRDVMAYWANFAKSGNPNDDGLPLWPRYDSTARRSLQIGGYNGVVVTDKLVEVSQNQCPTWDAIAEQRALGFIV